MMNLVFLISVILKGIGAALEVLLQITLTKWIGVTGYGNYSACISSADLIFWVLFSGIVKCNIFYESRDGASIRSFKVKYYLRYVLPVMAAGLMGAALAGQYSCCLIVLIALAELLVMDQSSSLLAKGRYHRSLIGEYVLGRLILLLGTWGFLLFHRLTLNRVILLYLFQYLCVILFFSARRKTPEAQDISDRVSLKKWGMYQRADIVQSMISHLPVLLQYAAVGAFETGFVSIVLLVKKLINFISGPMAKIFLPEFSRLFQEGRTAEIRSCFASIMRMQMLVAGPLAVVLIGYPKAVLGILAKELVPYAYIFMGCAAVFLIAATLGPCGGVLQMTNNERIDNRCRKAALLVMFLVMIVFHKSPLFTLYGLCIQAALESVSKYVFVCRWMKKSPVSLAIYLKWWIAPVIAILLTYGMHLQTSVLAMFLSAGAVFCITLFKELRADHRFRNLRKK